MRLDRMTCGRLVRCFGACMVWLTVYPAYSAVAEEAGGWIAGVQPDRRPENAPVIRQFEKSGDWYDQALKGVEQPYPGSLRFLEDQEAWFTPFNRAGMTGRYDIRALHQR